MDNLLVSVIVPIYNVQNYLQKCIDSITAQTYKNLEIILVDDGSPDDCGQICEQNKDKDSRIKVIHKENGGLSDARNAGMRIATGSYYVFIDSDDYIHNSMIEELVKAVTKTGADMAVCNFKNVSEDESIDTNKELICEPYKMISSEDERLKAFYEETCTQFTVAWNKIYPAAFFKDIEYPKGKVHEDEFTTYKLLEQSSKVAYIDTPLYYYVSRQSSIMGEKFGKARLYRLDAILERMDYFLAQKRYKWYEKNLFLYRIFLVKYSKAIKRQNMDESMLDPYFKAYRSSVLKNIFKTDIRLDKKLGYIYLALFPSQYIKSRG